MTHETRARVSALYLLPQGVYRAKPLRSPSVAPSRRGGGVFTDMSVSPRAWALSFCSTYNTTVRSFSSGPRPKAGRGYGGATEGFRLPEVLYDCWCGAPHRGVRGLGRGLCTNPRP